MSAQVNGEGGGTRQVSIGGHKGCVRNMLSYYLWLPYYMAAVLLFMAAILWQLYYYTLYMVFRSPVGFCGWSVAI